jgi:hypothetical protein
MKEAHPRSNHKKKESDRDHVSLRHVLGENVFFFAKTKIPPKYGIYGLEPTADHNPGPKSLESYAG